MEHSMRQHHYARLGTMFVLHFIAMYILMYAMVHNLSANVYNSLNQFYMAGLMTASMVAIELLLMGSMYANKRLNAVLVAASLALLAVCFLFIRQQTLIADRQFIRSMIPHHAGAILMCQQAEIHDAELQGVCKEIIRSQQAEIEQMKAIMQRLK